MACGGLRNDRKLSASKHYSDDPIPDISDLCPIQLSDLVYSKRKEGKVLFLNISVYRYVDAMCELWHGVVRE